MMESDGVGAAGPERKNFSREIVGEVPGYEVSWQKVEARMQSEAGEAGLRSDTFSHVSGEEKTSR